jgi:hypothetical protein
MPAGSTYTPIATTTLGSATSTVTFSSISGSYTDLRFIINYGLSTVTSARLKINSDSSTNYSYTGIRGNGTNATSYRSSSSNIGTFAFNIFPDNTLSGNAIIDFQNYSNTTTNKTWLSRSNAIGGSYAGAEALVGLWRQTSALSSVEFSLDAGQYITGSTFTLYGIASA